MKATALFLCCILGLSVYSVAGQSSALDMMVLMNLLNNNNQGSSTGSGASGGANPLSRILTGGAAGSTPSTGTGNSLAAMRNNPMASLFGGGSSRGLGGLLMAQRMGFDQMLDFSLCSRIMHPLMCMQQTM